MIEIEKEDKVIFSGSKDECVEFLKKLGIINKNETDIRLLTMATLATKFGLSMFSR